MLDGAVLDGGVVEQFQEAIDDFLALPDVLFGVVGAALEHRGARSFSAPREGQRVGRGWGVRVVCTPRARTGSGRPGGLGERQLGMRLGDLRWCHRSPRAFVELGFGGNDVDAVCSVRVAPEGGVAGADEGLHSGSEPAGFVGRESDADGGSGFAGGLVSRSARDAARMAAVGFEKRKMTRATMICPGREGARGVSSRTRYDHIRAQ